jgi:hypothetical protein
LKRIARPDEERRGTRPKNKDEKFTVTIDYYFNDNIIHLGFKHHLDLKYLSLCICFLLCQNILAQNSYLQIKIDDEVTNKWIDSIGYVKKHGDAKSVLTELTLFSEKVLRLGFLESEFEASGKLNDSTFLYKGNLGKRTHFLHLYVGTNLALLNIEKDSLKIRIAEVENFMQKSLSILEKKGYSLAKLQLVNYRKVNHVLFADLKIDTQKMRRLDDIVVNGYEKFPDGFKKNIKRLYRNKIFNQDNLQKIQADFEKLRFVSQRKYPEILFGQDSTKVYVYLEKAKPNTFDGFIGFNNSEEQKIIVNGYLDIQLQNILNAGEKFSLYWKSDGKKQTTFNVAIETPYLFKTPLGLKAQLNIFKQDSIFQNTQTGIDLGYYFNYNTKVYLGYQEAESSDIQNTNNSIISDYKNSFITTHLDYFSYAIDDYLFPERTAIYFKLGTGKRNSKIKSDSQFFSALNLSHNFYLNKKNVINLRSLNYYLKSDSYIINELYRFGGINSIRGFNENSLQGNVFTSLLTEYRYVANPNLYLHSIIDYGYFQDQSSKISNTLLGLGVGFGIVTKNGLINLIYANGSTKDQTIKISNSIVHVSFRTRF